MAIIKLFSKRQKELRGEVVDVYFYDKIPSELRVQVVHLIRDTIGKDISQSFYSDNNPYKPYELIHESLCREYGVFTLGHGKYDQSAEECIINFLLETRDIEKGIDVIELCFRYIQNVIGENVNRYKHYFQTNLNSVEAIGELNYRFKEHGFGFQFDEEMIRVNSTYIHSAIVKPTIHLLSSGKFDGANEEFLKAHEHYRHSRNKECLNECLKAFESTMKIICTEKGWTFNPTDTANKLVQICFQNNLVPTFTQNQFSSLQNLLVSGIPTIRNKLGGHGQGQTPQKVDDEMTRYALNLTGTNIIFIVEQSGIK